MTNPPAMPGHVGRGETSGPEEGQAARPLRPWWLDPLPSEAQREDGGARGLTSAQARDALSRCGPNRLDDHALRSMPLQFLARFKNPLVLILLAASAVSAASGDLANFAIIAVIVLLSATLDFVQEHRAGRAVEKLRESVSLRASVMRDGLVTQVPVAEVAPGDVALLSAGDRVPADGRLLVACDFFVNQGLLTGESYPVEKHAGALDAGATELQQATNAVFMGTSVISGSARVLITATGARTALGDVAHSIAVEPPPSSFEIGTHRFGVLILRLTVLLVAFVLLVNLLQRQPMLDSFLFAVALAVGLTPELLPMVVSVTLARGAVRMARQRVIVKRMASIQDLGSMDVLCTDKTGTLTEAQIRLERCIDANGRDSRHVLMLAYLNSVFESGLKSPLDEAILAHGKVDTGRWTKIDEVPFDFERRRVSVLIDRGDARWLVVKGAPDDVLSLCSHVEPDSGQAGEQDAARSPVPLDALATQRLQGHCHDLEREGMRVLAVAWRAVPSDHAHADVRDEKALVFAGFAAFIDPPKPGAGDALAALEKSGVAVKIVTGDSELVTQHLCGLLHIRVAGVLTGHQIAQMDEPALRAKVGSTNLFCRVNPAQKNRVILALKARGHVVGYLGDGINDAPSLRSADVGLTVDSAVDVAKEVADMILLDHDLGVLHEGVLEGRRSFGNIMKYIMMGTSSNFGNMLSMAGASLFLPFLPMLPTQILLNNILYDVSEVPIPLDRVDAEDLRRPRAWDMRFIQRFMWFFGLLSSLFDFLTFYLLIAVLHADQGLFRTGWFIESLVTQVLVIFVIRTRRAPWASRPSIVLLATSLTVAGIAVLLPFTPLGRAFGFEPPPLIFFGLLLGMLIAYLAAVEGAKRFFYRHVVKRPHR